MPQQNEPGRQPTGTVLSIGSIATTDGTVIGVLVEMDMESVRMAAALLDELVVIAPVGALSNLHTSASPARGEAVAVSNNPTPVLCPECGWCGRADELGPEGECGGGDDCSGFPGEITDHADLIHAWQDSEGMVAGRQCADAGLIEPHPATEDEAERLDIAPGDSVWELTYAGRAALEALGWRFEADYDQDGERLIAGAMKLRPISGRPGHYDVTAYDTDHEYHRDHAACRGAWSAEWDAESKPKGEGNAHG